MTVANTKKISTKLFQDSYLVTLNEKYGIGKKPDQSSKERLLSYLERNNNFYAYCEKKTCTKKTEKPVSKHCEKSIAFDACGKKFIKTVCKEYYMDPCHPYNQTNQINV